MLSPFRAVWGLLALAAVAGIAAGSLAALALSTVGSGSSPLTLTGLQYPRGLAVLEDGGLMVAEVMGGRLLRVDEGGDVEVAAEGFPATFAGPGGSYPTGVSAALPQGDALYYVVGEHRGQGYSTLYRLEHDGTPQPVAGGVGTDGFPSDRITNPYDLAPAPRGGVFVSDSALNAVLRVERSGEVSDYARFSDREPDGDGDTAQQSVEVVPTGLATGPDGALYAASLTGFPYPPGGASIYRMEDGNGDGDALDQGETTVFATGFSAATDLAFAGDGSLLVAEFSTDMLALITEMGIGRAAEAPGRLVRWRDGEVEVVAAGLVSPTSVAVSRGRVFVSEEFAGRVTEIETPATPQGSGPVWPWAVLAGAVVGALVAGGGLTWRKVRTSP